MRNRPVCWWKKGCPRSFWHRESLGQRLAEPGLFSYPRSPGTHTVGSWVVDSISLYRDPRTGTQYIGNWASRVRTMEKESSMTGTEDKRRARRREI